MICCTSILNVSAQKRVLHHTYLEDTLYECFLSAYTLQER